jgi:hypothetical protein
MVVSRTEFRPPGRGTGFALWPGRVINRESAYERVQDAKIEN